MFSFMKYQIFVPKTPNIFAIIPGPPSPIVHGREEVKTKEMNCTCVRTNPHNLPPLIGIGLTNQPKYVLKYVL